MPTRAGASRRSSRSRGDPALSWHIIESLVADEFDITMCQEMLVDHALTLPMALLWPGGADWPVRIVPIAMNHVQHPLPSPRRAYRLGQAVGRALDAWDEDVRVLVLGTGGLSHQLDGKRAGFINKPFDLMCMDALVGDPERLTRYSTLDIVREAGAQGTELMAWIAARGALTRSRDQGPLELPHPDLQHGDGPDGARERATPGGAVARGLRTTEGGSR